MVKNSINFFVIILGPENNSTYFNFKTIQNLKKKKKEWKIHGININGLHIIKLQKKQEKSPFRC